MPTTQLTPHITLEEFTASQTASRMGLDNMPTGQNYENVEQCAKNMEKVRAILGEKPILISSGYRSPAVNAACGGSSTSAHMSGLAADFTCPGFGDPHAICKKLEPLLKELEVDQLIYEYASWVHIGWTMGTPRNQTLTIDNRGTRSGIA